MVNRRGAANSRWSMGMHMRGVTEFLIASDHKHGRQHSIHDTNRRILNINDIYPTMISFPRRAINVNEVPIKLA